MKAEIDWAAVYQTEILVIDDSNPMRELLSGLLRETGCKNITKAAGGKQGLKLKKAQPIQMIFLDIEMPDINGLEVLKEVKQYNPNIFVTILSGHSTPDNVKEALTNGANDFIVKPCSLGKIVESLEKFARRNGVIKVIDQ